MAKVSVIVPVYNAHRTLTGCLGNLVNQTLTDIEIILVNDCSKDDSLDIMYRCEERFPDKVMVINLDENLGPGGARNVGISYASGEYLGFVDSDDYADPTMYEKLYKLASENNFDMVDCAYFDEAKNEAILLTEDDCTGEMTPYKRDKLISGGGYLWSRLYRRELFDGIEFRRNTILEDMEVMMLIYMKASKVGTTKEILYKYSQSPTSASKVVDVAKGQGAIVGAMKAVYAALSTQKEFESVQHAMEYSILNLYKHGLENLECDKNIATSELREYQRALYELRKSYVSIPIDHNRYTKQKFNKYQIEMMKRNDRRFATE